jgi:hypothetical protein
MLDIFNEDPFSVFSLTEAINNTPYVPGHIGRLGIFSNASINTLAVGIENRNGVLVLVEPSPRGGPGQTVEKKKRSLKMLGVPHFQIDDAIYADEVQGVRAFGTETQLETVMGKVDERMSEHAQSFAATEEYHRIGAIKGIVTYADGTTLNLFTEFGVSQEAEIDFDLDNANPTPGILRKKCAALYRTVANNLGAVPFSGILRRPDRACRGSRELSGAGRSIGTAARLCRQRPVRSVRDFRVRQHYLGKLSRRGGQYLLRRQRQGALFPDRRPGPLQVGLCSGRLHRDGQHDGQAALHEDGRMGQQQGRWPRSPDQRAAVLHPPEGADEGQADLIR